MESERLYQVQKEDLPKLENLLTQCFREDPLYHSLIPNKDVRERLMPELFKCDLTEFYECCDIYADSPECNSLLVVSDEMEPYEHLFKAYFTEIAAALKTDGYLLKEDASMDRPAASETSPSCNLSGGATEYAASWVSGCADE